MTDFLLDTDIVSIFAKAEALSLLCRLFQCERLPITSGVFDELLVPLEYGYDFPQRVLALAEVVAMAPEEIEDYEALRLRGKVSAADAELIAICRRRGWTYVAMDRVALRCAEEYGVRHVIRDTQMTPLYAGGLEGARVPVVALPGVAAST
jgi:predicted nucleic acid-binding protein